MLIDSLNVRADKLRELASNYAAGDSTRYALLADALNLENAARIVGRWGIDETTEPTDPKANAYRYYRVQLQYLRPGEMEPTHQAIDVWHSSERDASETARDLLVRSERPALRDLVVVSCEPL